MDDERLASELERRSRAASPRPDWAQRDLLPAVSREIDARPQPVVTSRHAPRLGLVAVVVALLIMVLAVPRLVPAPPTSSSSPTETATPLAVSVPPTPSPSPSPSPTANPPFVDVTHACTSADSATDRIVEFMDHAGLIESCSTRLVDWPGQQFVISDLSRGVVRIAFEDGCAGASDARLDLWDRGDDSPSYEPRYFLNVELQRPVAPLGCRNAMAGIAVVITFMNAELAPASLASEIEAVLTVDGRGVDSAQSLDGALKFRLEISVDRPFYAQSQPIAVPASLLSETDTTITGLVGPYFGVEQLDGPIRHHPGSILTSCPSPVDLIGGEPVVTTTPSWPTSSVPVDAFVDAHVIGGELRLPPGTYRFYALSDFFLGEGCDGEQLELNASVVVRVQESVDQEPTPSPTVEPTASPGLTARERIDQYWFDFDDVECMGMLVAQSLEEAVEGAELVVLGRPRSSEPWPDSPYQFSTHLINFEVSEVLTGAMPDEASNVVRVLGNYMPPLGDISDIVHLLLLSHTNRDDGVYYLTEGWVGIYANVDGRVVTPNYAAVKARNGNHIFSTALDGIRFVKLLERVRDAANSSAQQRVQGDQRALFAC